LRCDTNSAAANLKQVFSAASKIVHSLGSFRCVLSGKLAEESFHFGAGVLVALFIRCGDAVRKNLAGLFVPRFARQKLSIH
jgi:hypothetical protein